jgi:hypothetical protein
LEIPELHPIELAITEPHPAPAPQPEPEPVIKAPEPVIPAPEPIIKAPTPVTIPEPVKVPDVSTPIPELTPPAEPALKPAEFKRIVKPARKPVISGKKLLGFLAVALAVAGITYQAVFNNAKARYAQANEMVRTARNSEAISAYTKIIAQYSGSPEAAYSQYAIADIKALQGDIPGAIERYEQFLLAAPDKDPKIAQAKFKIAELELKEGSLSDAAFMYQNADIQASTFSVRAAERVNQIKAVNAQVAAAQKLIAKDPAKAMETYFAVLADYPEHAQAKAGLEEAKKALAAAKDKQDAKAAAKAKKAAKAATASAKPAPAAKTKAAGARTPYTKEQFTTCNSVWMMEKIQGSLDGDMTVSKLKNNCDALKADLAACKDYQQDYKNMTTLTAEARALMEEEVNPDWTTQKQVEQDKATMKKFEEHHCGEVMGMGH